MDKKTVQQMQRALYSRVTLVREGSLVSCGNPVEVHILNYQNEWVYCGRVSNNSKITFNSYTIGGTIIVGYSSVYGFVETDRLTYSAIPKRLVLYGKAEFNLLKGHPFKIDRSRIDSNCIF